MNILNNVIPNRMDPFEITPTNTAQVKLNPPDTTSLKSNPTTAISSSQVPYRHYIFTQRDPSINLREGHFIENFQQGSSWTNLFYEKIPSIVKSVFHNFYVKSAIKHGCHCLAIFSQFRTEAHGEGSKSHGGMKKIKISITPGVPYRKNYNTHIAYYFPGAGLMDSSSYPSEFIDMFNYFIPNFDNLRQHYLPPNPIAPGKWEYEYDNISSTSGSDFCTYTVMSHTRPITHFSVELTITLQDGSVSRLGSILEVPNV